MGTEAEVETHSWRPNAPPSGDKHGLCIAQRQHRRISQPSQRQRTIQNLHLTRGTTHSCSPRRSCTPAPARSPPSPSAPSPSPRPTSTVRCVRAGPEADTRAGRSARTRTTSTSSRCWFPSRRGLPSRTGLGGRTSVSPSEVAPTPTPSELARRAQGGRRRRRRTGSGTILLGGVSDASLRLPRTPAAPAWGARAVGDKPPSVNCACPPLHVKCAALLSK